MHNPNGQTHHSHDHPHGHDHDHDHHEHPHDHTEYHHVHPENERKAVLNRLSRIIGHLESVRHMVREDRDCSEVLVQLSAVRSAVTSTGKLIMIQHLEHCIVDAVRNNEPQRIEELKNAIDQFIK